MPNLVTNCFTALFSGCWESKAPSQHSIFTRNCPSATSPRPATPEWRFPTHPECRSSGFNSSGGQPDPSRAHCRALQLLWPRSGSKQWSIGGQHSDPVFYAHSDQSDQPYYNDFKVRQFQWRRQQVMRWSNYIDVLSCFFLISILMLFMVKVSNETHF